jgi:hypothetical protein
MEKLLRLLVLPMLLINWGFPIVGAVWLIVSGEWAALGLGAVCMIGGPFIISLAMLPGYVLAAPVLFASLHERASGFLAALLVLPTALWTFAVISVWCVGIFAALQLGSADDLVPRILWAYGAATGPWIFMAQKEMQSDSGSHAPMAVFFTQLGCLSIIISIFVGSGYQTIFGMALFFVPFMLATLIIQISMILSEPRRLSN